MALILFVDALFLLLCSLAARQLGSLGCPPFAGWVRVHPLYVLAAHLTPAPAPLLALFVAVAVAVPLCAVHCCCVLLLLIFLSALLFIATEKCLPTTQGKLDCNFYRRQILFSLLTARASTVLLFPFSALPCPVLHCVVSARSLCGLRCC